MESWDDDLDLQGPIVTNTQQSAKTSLSISSRRSFRSDSNAGDEDWDLPLSPTNPQSTTDAISHAKQAGIPLPDNVPSSALVGGSIKKLGNKKARAKETDNDDWAEDLEMPDADAGTLTLKPVRKEAPSQIQDHDDFSDRAEGSLGIRTGGTRRTSKNRSSSISAMSPSMGSCMTFESEEDGLEGLIIPNGPVDFENTLKKRKEEGLTQDDAHDAATDEPQTIRPQSTVKGHDDDDLDDLDFGPDGVFDSKNHLINRNVKTSWKPGHTGSPASRAQTTLTFSDRPTPTRLPRPVPSNKPPTRLEPVMESGATNISKPRRAEPTHSNARALRSKRSMPNLYSQRSAGGIPPPSTAAKSDQKPPQQAPPLMSFKQRQTNMLQGHGRHNSDPHRAASPIARPAPRPHSGQAPETPTRARKDVAPTSLAKEVAAKRAITRPTKRRNFGDGTELDLFDDLPTSNAKENKFTKQPSARPKSVALRSQASESHLGMRDKMTTPTMQPPQTPKSPTKADSLPRFARDTAASRNAREQKASLPSKRSESVLASRTNWPAQVAARSPASSPRDRKVAKKGPTLINPMVKENIRHCKTFLIF